MSTAIILTGHMRTFDVCFDRLKRHVFDAFPGAAFYVATVQDADSHKADLCYRLSRHVTVATCPEQPDCIADLRAKGCQLPTSWTLGLPYMKERDPISVHPQAVARQLWQLEHGWKLMKEKGRLYTTVVRCRPDLWVHSADLKGVHQLGPLDAFTPWWGRFGGVNDRFAVLGAKAAEAYFTTYSQIPAHLAAGGNLHPETLVHASLKAAECTVHDTLDVLYSTKRASQVRPPEIHAEDVAHLALHA